MRRVCLDRVEVDVISFEDAVTQIMLLTRLPYTHCRQIATVNAQFVGAAHRNARLAGVIRQAWMSVADGVPLVWAARLLGMPLPGRVNGTDLMVRLCEEAAAGGESVYFLGGHPGSAQRAAEVLTQRNPGLRIAGIDCPALGFHQDPELDAEVCERIRHARPDIVFVALGMPKAEFWIHEHAHLPAKVMIGVGGSFELVGGVIRRAPSLLQQLGCEWLWRLAMEPRRLWRRYVFGNALFVYLVLRQWILDAEPRATKPDMSDA